MGELSLSPPRCRFAGNTSSRSGTSTCTRAGGGDNRLEDAEAEAEVEAEVDDGLAGLGGETAGEVEEKAEKNEVELAKPRPPPP